MGVHISGPICTTIAVGGLWHVGKDMSTWVLQPDYQEASGKPWNPENRNPLYNMYWVFQAFIIDFSATTEPISTKLGVCIDTLCQSTNVENKNDPDAQLRVTASKPEMPFSR